MNKKKGCISMGIGGPTGPVQSNTTISDIISERKADQTDLKVDLRTNLREDRQVAAEKGAMTGKVAMSPKQDRSTLKKIKEQARTEAQTVGASKQIKQDKGRVTQAEDSLRKDPRQAAKEYVAKHEEFSEDGLTLLAKKVKQKIDTIVERPFNDKARTEIKEMVTQFVVGSHKRVSDLDIMEDHYLVHEAMDYVCDVIDDEYLLRVKEEYLTEFNASIQRGSNAREDIAEFSDMIGIPLASLHEQLTDPAEANALDINKSLQRVCTDEKTYMNCVSRELHLLAKTLKALDPNEDKSQLQKNMDYIRALQSLNSTKRQGLSLAASVRAKLKAAAGG
ncbi:hypothetical protein N9N03_00570 [Chlamydiia bacterium]|nr:hypothetical protein [Chlamydiia bacterium]